MDRGGPTPRVPYPSIPAADSANNNNFADVLGQKGDSQAGDSLYAFAYALEEHSHSPCQVYPTLAGGANLIDGGAAWTYGGYVQIVPVNTITDPFDIHWLIFEQISANDVYQIEIVYGAGDTYAGEQKFVKTAVQEQVGEVPFQTVIIPANSRVRARVASATGGNNVDVSISYHVY